MTNDITKFAAILLFSFVIACLAVVPAWWLWNNLAPIYFYQLPSVYLSVPFWDFVGLIWLAAIARGIIFGGFSKSSK